MTTTTPVKKETLPAAPVTNLWDAPFGFPLFHRLSRELDAMFDRFGMERPVLEHVPTMWSPEIEVATKENEFLVRVDVPGMKKEDITVEFTGEHLLIRGERKYEKEEKKEGYFKTERSYGSFCRAVPLPEGVKPEDAKATMSDGVLAITMPMAKIETKSRKLEINEPATAKAIKAA